MTVHFFFNETATTEIYTLSLHDALPISRATRSARSWRLPSATSCPGSCARSEEHTSELQSRRDLVCRLLLEKKKSHRAGERRSRARPVDRRHGLQDLRAGPGVRRRRGVG